MFVPEADRGEGGRDGRKTADIRSGNCALVKGIVDSVVNSFGTVKKQL